MRRQPTAAQKAAAEARRNRFRELVKNVADMTDEQRAEIVNNFGAIVTCEGRVLSHFNTCLILSQTEGKASMVGGFNQWKDKGRSVKKGEHGLMIWIPSIRKGEQGSESPTTGDVDKVEMRFTMGTVFDITQTEETAAREVETAEAA